MNIICMVPERLGSKRIPKKNLKKINKKPLICYVLKTLTNCKFFDKIYVNSESKKLESIAKKYNHEFYLRKKIFSTDKSTNDEFALDFINNIEGDILIQVLPTSPFITNVEINNFVKTMIKNNYDTLITVEEKQIACVYKNKPINFDKFKINPPSQTMQPVQIYSTVLMGWKYKNYIDNMKKYNCAYHGGSGKIGFFPLRGLSTIDIDTKEDFKFVKELIESKKI